MFVTILGTGQQAIVIGPIALRAGSPGNASRQGRGAQLPGLLENQALRRGAEKTAVAPAQGEQIGGRIALGQGLQHRRQAEWRIGLNLHLPRQDNLAQLTGFDGRHRVGNAGFPVFGGQAFLDARTSPRLQRRDRAALLGFAPMTHVVQQLLAQRRAVGLCGDQGAEHQVLSLAAQARQDKGTFGKYLPLPGTRAFPVEGTPAEQPWSLRSNHHRPGDPVLPGLLQFHQRLAGVQLQFQGAADANGRRPRLGKLPEHGLIEALGGGERAQAVARQPGATETGQHRWLAMNRALPGQFQAIEQRATIDERVHACTRSG